MKNILFISHKKIINCGVYQFGKNIAEALLKSQKYNYIYAEISSNTELKKLINIYNPSAIIFNHTKDTMPWLGTCSLPEPIIGIIHEIKQNLADAEIKGQFDFYMAPDPTLILKNSLIYKTGRLLLKNNIKVSNNIIPIISSFGLATENKKYLKIIQTVCSEFDEAIIRFNIPIIGASRESKRFYDDLVKNCHDYIANYPEIKLEISNEYLSNESLLKFLGESSLNIFWYEDRWERGISSAIDYALSVKVPIAIAGKTDMFRHIAPTGNESFFLSKKNSLKKIIERGVLELDEFYKEWSEENLIWDYDRIIRDVIEKCKAERKWFIQNRCVEGFYKRLKRLIKRRLNQRFVSDVNSWSVSISNYKDLFIEKKSNYLYEPIDLGQYPAFNTILDDKQRLKYAPSIMALNDLVPRWMERKVSNAVVQQGFIFDTVMRFMDSSRDFEILCVGSFEDTAFGGLVALGYSVTGIDPVLNYDIDKYVDKPNTAAESYDLIFSTSVIEHVEDDLNFLKKMDYLLKPGGKILLTCDYRKNYKAGDPKPGCDFRLYTREHLLSLVNKIPSLSFFDTPNWDEFESDFGVGDQRYCFATVVLEKNQNI